MKKFYLLIIVFFYYLSAKSQVEFSPDKFSDTKKMHKKIVEVTPDLLLKHNVKHLQIIECKADITVAGESVYMGFSKSEDFRKYYKEKHPRYSKKIGEDYFETALDVVYNRFNKMLSDNGLFPVEKEDVINNPTFVKNELQKKDYKEYTGGKISDYATGNEFIACSSGMNPLPVGLDYNSAEEFNQELAKIGNDNEAEAALKIHIGLTIDENGAILLTKYNVLMDTWISAYKKGTETKYKWKMLDTKLFELKSEIEGSTGHEDLDSLDTELIHIFDTITEMYSFALSSHL